MAEEQPEVRMLVSVERQRHFDDGVVYVVARPVHIELDEQRVEHVRNISTGSIYRDPLADLQVRCYVSAEEWYGYSTEYRDVFSVDEEGAHAMAKLLGKTRRGMEKLERELGFAESYPAYLARVAKVLRITQFGFKASGDGGMWHDGNQYRWRDASYLRDMIARQVADEQKAHAR